MSTGGTGNRQTEAEHQITVGLLVQWPTIITVATWPLLIAMYYRLARREERDAEATFGDAFRAYRARTPMFVPRLGARRPAEPRWTEHDDRRKGASAA